jgi:hypothetical protein
MTKLSIVLAAALCAAPAFASHEVEVQLPYKPDTLIPGASISESTTEHEYATILKGAFPELFAPDVRARLIFENPFAGGMGGGGAGGTLYGGGGFRIG